MKERGPQLASLHPGRFSQTIAALIVFLAVQPPISAFQRQDDPWAKLQVKMAWIFIGVWDGAHHEWQTAPELGYAGQRDSSLKLLPMVGDRIEPAFSYSRISLAILNYQAKGEQNRFVSPTGHERIQSAEVGTALKRGDIVVVSQVSKKAFRPGMFEVWARVVPESNQRGTPR